MTTAKHTPGPWRWEVNRAHKSIKLCGGPSHRGYGRFDLTVMDFARYGMTGAAPVFWNWDLDKSVGERFRADVLAEPVAGREHHASWFADINHPDALLIAAAPVLREGADAALDLVNDLLAGIGITDERLREVGGLLAHGLASAECLA